MMLKVTHILPPSSAGICDFRCLLSLMLNSLFICQDMATEFGMGHSLYQSVRMRLAQTNFLCHGMTVFDL